MRILDLTLTISKRLPSFPGSPQPQFIPWSSLDNDGYNLELLFLSSHTGTHIDAPYHFVNNGITIEKIPLDRLVVDAILIKIRKKSSQLVTKKDILDFEKTHGAIPKNSSVVFFTNWQQYLHNKNYFANNPGLSISAARYLISKKINLVGIDSPSIDQGNDHKFSVHKIFAQNNILIVENLSNLDQIKSTQFRLGIFPLKLGSATGSPVRAIAF